MLAERVESTIRVMDVVAKDSRIDVEPLNLMGFRAVEVRPDLSVGKRFIGYMSPEIPGAVMISEEAEMNLDQARIYDYISKNVIEKVKNSEAEGLDDFGVMNFGDYPEVFDLSLTRPNIPGNALDGKMAVWHAIENLLESFGYQVYLEMQGFHEEQTSCADWTIRARSRQRPL